MPVVVAVAVALPHAAFLLKRRLGSEGSERLGEEYDQVTLLLRVESAVDGLRPVGRREGEGGGVGGVELQNVGPEVLEQRNAKHRRCEPWGKER